MTDYRKSDTTIIEGQRLEELTPLDYYIECILYLKEFIEKNPAFKGCDIDKKVESFLNWWDSNPDDRKPDETTAESMSRLSVLYGRLGQALCLLRDNNSAQFRTEVKRVFEGDEIAFRGNYWLFHISGKMKANGYDIEFIPERGKEKIQTPDFSAEKDGFKFFIEANTRSQNYTAANDIEKLVWAVIQDKQAKFASEEYCPGMIVADASESDLEANNTGLPANVKLRKDCLTYVGRTRVYDLSKDNAFFQQPENTGNIVEYCAKFFHGIDRSRYCVNSLLVGYSMRIENEKVKFKAPLGAVQFVDGRYKEMMLPFLAPQIYLIDVEGDI